IADTVSPIAAYLRTLLLPVWKADRAGVRRVVDTALASTDTLILAGIAGTIGQLGPLESEERAVVRILAQRREPAIVLGVLDALKRFPLELGAEVDEIATAVDIGNEPRLADALSELYAVRADKGLPDDLWRLIHTKLLPIADIPSRGTPTHDLIGIL